MKKLLMPIYYIIHFRRIIPCYLIKEGYIPCSDYRPNSNDNYYCAYPRGQFCIVGANNREGIYENKKEVYKIAKEQIEKHFYMSIRNKMESRDNELKSLEKFLKGGN